MSDTDIVTEKTDDSIDPSAAAEPAITAEDGSAAASPEPEVSPELGDADAGQTVSANDSISSMLSICSAGVGVIGVILAIFVSWILSVLAGIIALALAQLAASKHAPYPVAIRAGRILGVLCIVANIAMVAIYIYQLMSLGVL